MRQRLGIFVCVLLVFSASIQSETLPPTHQQFSAEEKKLPTVDESIKYSNAAIDAFFATILPVEKLKDIKPLGITIPNLVTTARLILAPLLVGAIHNEKWQKAFNIFVIAALSDKVDGSLARVLDQKIELGNILDHYGDMLLVFAYFWALLTLNESQKNVPIGKWFVVTEFTMASIYGAAQTLSKIKHHHFLPKVSSINTRFLFIIETAFMAWLLFSVAHNIDTRLFNTLTGLSIVLFEAAMLSGKISLGFKNELAELKEFLEEQLVQVQQEPVVEDCT